MLTKTKKKKNRKNLNIENFEKKRKQIVRGYDGEGATHKICSGSMQRFPRNLSLRTTDGRRTPAP